MSELQEIISIFFTKQILILFALSVLNVICLPDKSGENLMCKDDKGLLIDWFIIYKPPFLSNPDNGTRLFYMDQREPKWRKLNGNITHEEGNPLAWTLKSIYENEENKTIHVMYNDQTPRVDHRRPHGHTKGVINFDMKSGYWLIHSVPRFPPPKRARRYSYVNTGLKFGQMFFCLSLDYKHLDTLGNLLLYNNPKIYDYLLPKEFISSVPNLTAVIKGEHLNDSRLIVSNFSSPGGQRFLGFAKSSFYQHDLWKGIAKLLRIKMAVETWRRGDQGNLPPFCRRRYEVKNVLSLSVLGHKFLSLDDHSKWAVSVTDEQNARTFPGNVAVMRQNGKSMPWICIGDINRQPNQAHRGGGAVCLDHPKVVNSFRELLRSVDGCEPIYGHRSVV